MLITAVSYLKLTHEAYSAHTARHLYHNCLTSDVLMRSRTRIIVTHSLHLTLPLADYVIALSDGRVAFEGSPSDYVVASGANTPGISTGQDFSALSLKALITKAESLNVPIATEQAGDAAAGQSFEDHYLRLDDNPLQAESLMLQSEKQSVGAVSSGVYMFYIKACGSPLVISALVAVIVVTEVAAVGSNWALRLWASSFDRIEAAAFASAEARVSNGLSSGLEPAYRNPDYYLRIYIALVFSALVLFGLRMRKCSA